MIALKDPTYSWGSKLSAMLWFSKRAIFFDIELVSQYLFRLKTIINSNNQSFVTYSHDISLST
jgi:hypothetical protein